MTLTKADCKLLVVVLRMAEEEFSNHGCNDFNLDAYLTKEERTEFIADVNALTDFVDEPHDNSPYSLSDWLVMAALRRKVAAAIDEK